MGDGHPGFTPTTMGQRPMTPRSDILLIQLPIPPLGSQAESENVPLAAGCLAAALPAAHRKGTEKIAIFPGDEAGTLGDAALLQSIVQLEPAAIGFTCYLWNIERTLWLCRKIKERLSNTTILLGGPEIQPDNRWVWNTGGFDAAVVGEGEETFRRWCDVRKRRSAWVDVPGLWVGPKFAPPRQPAPPAHLASLPSPYSAGLLIPRETMWLETARGCRYRCKFCAYHQGRRAIRPFAEAEVRANLRLALRHRVREVFLLDPTLNQRRNFGRFIDLLAEENRDHQIQFSAELRAEGIDSTLASELRNANFTEVEIGLQTVEPAAQAAIGRRVDLDRFARGAKALRAAGIRTRTDLILGLPGDTIDSMRRAIDFLVDHELFDELQLFPLSLLPGTPLAAEAERWKLQAQSRPPYYVVANAAVNWIEIAELVEETQRRLGIEYDPAPLPPPYSESEGDAGTNALWLTSNTDANGCWTMRRVDLDRVPRGGRWRTAFAARPYPAISATIYLRSRCFARARHLAADIVRFVIDQNPFITLTVVLEPGDRPDEITPELAARLHAICREKVSYLDRMLSVQTDRRRGSRRIVVAVPETYRAYLGRGWRRSIESWANIIWRECPPSRAPRTVPPRKE